MTGSAFINPLWIAAFYGLSEILISSVLRARSGKDSDQGSLKIIWLTVNVCMTGAIVAYLALPSAAFGHNASVYWTGFAMFAGGIALRWYAIAYLGRFFTVNVAVAADQRVIDTGPYRWVRHPSYTGSLLAFAGVGLLLANSVSLVLTTLPIIIAFLHRMRIEEAALLQGLGDAYRRYMQRTTRLIPKVY